MCLGTCAEQARRCRRPPHRQDPEVSVFWDVPSVPWGHGPPLMAWGLVFMRQELSWSVSLHPKVKVKGK